VRFFLNENWKIKSFHPCRPESGVEGWVKRGGEASGPSRQKMSEGGPLAQQYQAAAAFLQSIFDRGEQVGPFSKHLSALTSYRVLGKSMVPAR